MVETLYEAIYEDGGANGARDAMGRIVRKTERIVSGDVPTIGARPLETRVYDYGYNPAGRPWLESVAVNGTLVSSYSYDGNGNRVAAELAPSLLGADPANDVSLDPSETEYDLGDRLLRYGTKTYAWNDFGQLASVTDSATGETTAYDYDLFGNLLRVDLPDGRAVEYDVDGAGRRVGRRVLDAQGMEVDYRGWIYRDLLRPIAEVDAFGNVVARYVYADGTGADSGFVPESAATLGEAPFPRRNVPEYVVTYSMGEVAQVLRLLTDHLGTVRLVVDIATGTVVQRLEHDEFGRVLFDSDREVQPFGFAGGLYDSTTGLVRFGARDYEASLGRWIARDPIMFRGNSAGLFSYLDGDPMNTIDSHGTFGVGGAVAGCLVGGVLSGAWAAAGAGAGAALSDACDPLARIVNTAAGAAAAGCVAGAITGATGGGRRSVTQRGRNCVSARRRRHLGGWRVQDILTKRVLDFVGWLALFAGMTWLMRSVGLWVAVVVVAVAQVGVVSEPLRRRWKSSLLGGLVFVFCAGVFLASKTWELASALPAIGLVGVGALVDLRRGRFDRRRLPLPAWVGLAVLGIGLALVVVGTAVGQPALLLPGVAAGFVVSARAALPGRGAGG